MFGGLTLCRACSGQSVVVGLALCVVDSLRAHTKHGALRSAHRTVRDEQVVPSYGISPLLRGWALRSEVEDFAAQDAQSKLFSVLQYL